MRQPGSTIKPLSYLAALGKGLQPNTLISDGAITFPPIKRGRAKEQDYWSPKNYDGGGGGVMTMRSALENSKNLATVHLLQGGIEAKPDMSLDRLCELALEAQIYKECIHFYPFVLGAEPVRPIDLAAFYAAIANEGVRPTPHVIDSIERDGRVVYRYDTNAGMTRIKSVDQVAFYQLKTMMQGVLARGTARAIADLSPYVAGKTGTSDDENDAWFIGFTNDVTVAVWLGYDNAGKRRTLGGGATGGGVAVPIFEPVMRAVWNDVTPRTALAPPSPEAKRHLSCSPTESKSIPECLRTDNNGKVIDTTAALESDSGRYAKHGDEKGRHEEDGAKRKVAHEHSRRERATSITEADDSSLWLGRRQWLVRRRDAAHHDRLELSLVALSPVDREIDRPPIDRRRVNQSTSQSVGAVSVRRRDHSSRQPPRVSPAAARNAGFEIPRFQ